MQHHAGEPSCCFLISCQVCYAATQADEIFDSVSDNEPVSLERRSCNALWIRTWLLVFFLPFIEHRFCLQPVAGTMSVWIYCWKLVLTQTCEVIIKGYSGSRRFTVQHILAIFSAYVACYHMVLTCMQKEASAATAELSTLPLSAMRAWLAMRMWRFSWCSQGRD